MLHLQSWATISGRDVYTYLIEDEGNAKAFLTYAFNNEGISHIVEYGGDVEIIVK